MLLGAKIAIQKKLPNVAFLYLNINKLLEHIAPGSVEQIWITFPDPYPRARHAKHRLTSPFYMKIYRKILAPHGTIQLKTDDFALFSYTLDTIIQENCQILRQVNNVYADTPNDSILTIQTTFEKKHLANQKNIYYVQWCF
jgi:tRNA (guanine-N7-)-methyltransferase